MEFKQASDSRPETERQPEPEKRPWRTRVNKPANGAYILTLEGISPARETEPVGKTQLKVEKKYARLKICKK